MEPWGLSFNSFLSHPRCVLANRQMAQYFVGIPVDHIGDNCAKSQNCLHPTSIPVSVFEFWQKHSRGFWLNHGTASI
jgi:hypothetical protein